ncbi:outer membrane lipoprotein-sorting protein [Peristeroidobacter agariperforans]|uniref:outer membrane lipoprotein-sorting protein n=1 Tax=Peristeroidobacter agariperforans TaxID=268404 RepID=UPI00101C071E|nr:outer membrane lipoprotein-sorting protein [Peristeroidobacter agariperforans]
MRAYLEWIVRCRWLVLALTVLVAGLLASRIGQLRIEIDPARFLPQSHPYVVTSDRVEDLFGSRYVLVIGITPEQGDVYTPEVLGKVERITRGLREVPGVVKNNILSFSAHKAKSIAGSEDGMEVQPLMSEVPATPAALAALRKRVASNPAYLDVLVSKDDRSVAVLAEFKDNPKGFQAILDQINPIVDAERDASVKIAMGGLPVLLGAMETFSQRMGYLLPLAMMLIAIVLWFAFRSIQGLALPMLTATLAVLWSLGIMSLLRVPLDVFNATTPVLILAVAAGHAVQILRRYYEEYARQAALTPEHLPLANRRAVIESLSHVGPVMLIAGVIAALGFLSLLIFEISSVRTFGLMAACGILSSLVLELTLIPAMRSVMRAPRVRTSPAVPSSTKPSGMERAMTRLTQIVTDRATAVTIVALVVVALSAFGIARVRNADSIKVSFASHLPVIQDDNHLNRAFAGTNSLYVLVESATPDRMKDPDVLLAIDETQRRLQQDANVGRSLSIADFVRRMNQAMHGDDPAHDAIPTDPGLAAQYLFLYANSGDPGDFDTYVDYDYRHASIRAFLKEHDTEKLQALVKDLTAFTASRFPKDIKVSFGGSVAQGTAIHEIVSRAKILNMLQVAAVFFVLASLAFRSLMAGLLVLVPLAITVGFNLGLMGWTGIPYTTNNSITAAMAVGIGADYVVYMLFRLREEFAKDGSASEAMRRTLLGAGSAIVFVAVAIAAGYSVLILSPGFWNHIWMGILISTAMLTSALAALTLVPMLVHRLRPAFIYGRRAKAQPQPAIAAWLLVIGAALVQIPHARAGEPMSAVDIMQRNYAVDKVAGSQSRAILRLRNQRGEQRVRESDTVTRLQENGRDNQRLVRFQAPADVKGTGILINEHSQGDDDIWIYLPALKKVRRLVASNKKDSFAGTDFSYGDIIGYPVEEWTHTRLPDGAFEGEPCFMIESRPATAAAKDNSGYSSRVSCISTERFTTLRTEIWDTEGEKLKETEHRGFVHVDPKADKWWAMRATARNLQTGHSTEVSFEDYRLDAAIPTNMFTTRALEFAR